MFQLPFKVILSTSWPNFEFPAPNYTVVYLILCAFLQFSKFEIRFVLSLCFFNLIKVNSWIGFDYVRQSNIIELEKNRLIEHNRTFASRTLDRETRSQWKLEKSLLDQLFVLYDFDLRKKIVIPIHLLSIMGVTSSQISRIPHYC